ncbi:hypothetical protein AC622_14715 [Bacillus sp. FJAT-27916]|nr:hypothetical protein AC622_14715 [Bacillus sp. FJAT-27916]
MGRATHIPPLAHAAYRRGGGSAGEGWEEPRISHLTARLRIGEMVEGWEKGGKSHAYPTPCPGCV